MKFSLNWLNEFVDLTNLTHQELSNLLTNAGLEVVGITPLAEATNLVIGEIKQVEKHPNAETLSILQVDLGPKYGVSQIVCGAPNVKVGLKVIVARPGAVLSGNFKINVSELRGVQSNGMVCALNELGVPAKYLEKHQIEGIEELPSDAVVGNEDVLHYLGLDDYALEIDLLANRADASALLYLAFELQGLLGQAHNLPHVSINETFHSNVSVICKTPNCPQFSLRELRNIKNGPSPFWLKARLMASGIRSINKVVDFGNYVMLLTGQPLHLYDLDKLNSLNFVVEDDVDAPNFVALDEQKYHVLPKDIVITVDNDIKCLGGVMGSLASAVDEHTTNVVVEAANFNSAQIRTTALRLGLVSDSSQRFAKGINPHQASYVLDLTTSLFGQICDHIEVGQIVSVDEVNHTPQIIKSSFHKINHRLGTAFSNDEITKALSAVGISLEVFADDTFNATIPAHRIDFTSADDLSEEVIRILGFDSINVTLPKIPMTIGSRSEHNTKAKLLRNHLLSHGLYEALTYSLVANNEQTNFAYLNNGKPYVLLNQLTPDHKEMRLNTLNSLIQSARYNYARQNSDFGLFEVSDVYALDKPIQSQLSVVLVGNKQVQGQLNVEPYSFYDVKGLLASILALYGIAESRLKIERFKLSHDELHPGRSAAIYAGKTCIGVIGELHPSILSSYDFGKTPVSVLTLNLTELFKMKTSLTKLAPISRFPAIKRDLAIVVKDNVSVGDLIQTIRRSANKILRAVEVFDIYVGEYAQSNEKSVAFSLMYGDDNKTLTDLEINLAEEHIMNELARRYNAKRRK